MLHTIILVALVVLVYGFQFVFPAITAYLLFANRQVQTTWGFIFTLIIVGIAVAFYFTMRKQLGKLKGSIFKTIIFTLFSLIGCLIVIQLFKGIEANSTKLIQWVYTIALGSILSNIAKVATIMIDRDWVVRNEVF